MTQDLSARFDASFVEALRRIISAEKSKMRTGCPGVVQKYDPVLQKAWVQPVYSNGDTEPDVPTIPHVPVMFPSGGGYARTWPLEVGDTGWLHFAERDIHGWLVTGLRQPPLTTRKFDVSSCGFYPGVNPFVSPSLLTSSTDMLMGKEDFTSVLRITLGGQIGLGNEITGVDLLDVLHDLMWELTQPTAIVPGPPPVFNPLLVTALQALMAKLVTIGVNVT